MLTKNTNTQSQGYKKIKATRAKLTKNFHFNLLEGQFIVSDLFGPDHQPGFAGAVLPMKDRQEQWNRAVSKKFDQRLVEVFDCKEDADEYIKSFITEEDLVSNTQIRFRYSLKMSRDLFMSLSEGLFVASCSSYLDDSPCFYVETSPQPERGEQWKEIIKAGFGKTKCNVFNSQADMQEQYGHRGFTAVQEGA